MRHYLVAVTVGQTSGPMGTLQLFDLRNKLIATRLPLKDVRLSSLSQRSSDAAMWTCGPST